MTHISCYYEEGHPLKKHLLSTSAIALGVAMAAPATAQEWNLDWGGFMQQHVAWKDVSGTSAALVGTDYDGVDVNNNSEIHFTPSITLDNGLTFGATVEFEAINAGGGADGIDETYMTISSDTMGRIDIGHENSAGYKMMVAAPSVTSMGINSPSISGFIPVTAAVGSFGFRQAGASSYTEVAGNNDVARITYYTPSFNGLTLGISYAADAAGNAANVVGNKNAVLSDIFDIGIAYSQTFGTTSVSLAARYGKADSPVAAVSDPETWGIGMQIGFGDFTIGGAYAENDNGVVAGIGDEKSWSLGATYDAAGPWAFELQAFNGEIEAGAIDREYTAYKIGASRDLGPGVAWDIYAIQAEIDTAAAAGTDLKGTIIGTGINLSF